MKRKMNLKNLTSRLYAIILLALAVASVATTTAAQRQQPATPSPSPVQTPALKPVPTPVEDCGCEAAPLPEVLATVNGIRITKQDISAATQQRITQLQQQVVEARKRELDLQINSKLLEAEAKKRGVSSSKLIEAEIIQKAGEPTEAEAQKFYDENKARIQAEFKDVKNEVIEYLRTQRQNEQAKRFSEVLRTAAQVKKNVEVAQPPASAADRARVFATVNGQNITSADIEDSLRPLIYSVQEQVYNLRKQDVELKINDTLLEQEAQKRKVTTRALLETEVTSKVPVVSEAQAQKFFDENKDRINGDFAQTKYQIIQYLQERENQQANAAFATRLRSTAQVQTFLTPPEPPVYTISTDDQPSKGNPSAKVTIVEFTDFQCPSCAQAQPVLERIANEYADRVHFVVRDFPLSQHAQAMKAAEAAEAAREQGKYWEYVAILFRNQSALQVDKLKEYATQLGLDRAKFDAALDSGRFTDKVHRDMLEGQRVGVNGTPTIFINGRRVSDRSYEGLKAIVEAALRVPAK
ncbi:MAG TPA: thioredoxin domain-containing protein [Pyrinomonadaceae bacterium]|nr:thioredoxin domain-containing protein [Pyrinomonadaceae bacterium]